MQQQQENMIKSGRIINVRKLAALDIVFHGPRLHFWPNLCLPWSCALPLAS